MSGAWTRRLALAGAVIAAGISGASAQNFPAKPIVLIVPFAAGGPSDVIARMVGEHMGRTLGQQVVIENVAGAGGTAGAKRLVASAPDGYTLLIHHLALAAAPSLYNNLGYDTKTAFAPVGLINTGPMVVLGKNALAANDGRAFFAEAKARTLTMAHAGVGSNAHLCSVLLSQTLGVTFNEIAYRGTGPAMNDVVAGHVDGLCDQSTTAVPQINSKTVKAFAVTSPERLPALPNVPSMRETGVPLEMTIWHGLYAPKDTPVAALDVLNRALQAALQDKAVQERFAAAGTSAFPQGEWSRDAHGKRFAAEVDRWAATLKAAGLQAQAVQ